jgi:hypothetical protein
VVVGSVVEAEEVLEEVAVVEVSNQTLKLDSLRRHGTARLESMRINSIFTRLTMILTAKTRR